MTGVSDPFQPFDDYTPRNEISDFVMNSFDFDLPEWYEDEKVQEVTLLGDADNKDSTSLSNSADVVEWNSSSSETPVVAVSDQPEKLTMSKMRNVPLHLPMVNQVKKQILYLPLPHCQCPLAHPYCQRHRILLIHHVVSRAFLIRS